MSSERQINATLTKKLSGRKCPIKVESTKEALENRSQFFKEIKNKANKSCKTKKKDDTAKPENKEYFLKSAKLSNNDINKDENKIDLKGYSRKTRAKLLDKDGMSADVTQQKSEVESQNKNKNETKRLSESSASKKLKISKFEEEQWNPPNWEIMLENIRKMRCNDGAPVDTMGCHKCSDENADEKTQRFQKLIALMLSSQTKDETTYHAMLRLKEYNLTPQVICNMKTTVLENILHPVSFYKNKAKYMQKTSRILIEKYNSDIPNNIKDLMALPGVGPKMAHICMATAWYKVTGIGVDVHVHRISNRLGWVPKPTKEPEKTRVALESWLPQLLWSEVNHLLVGFGQTTCTPVKPKCSECLNFLICPSAAKNTK